ncbi:sigma-70 family RNA polymerase sigma factor [Clostridium weizhouense]|uniref:Sigma-70 family RNA polymerase sigma factor n=1 Tax=Clostridium weizhouense TaxID=2859781 RepID=A0ABS7AUX1_9CLOT|nr:sigma-70 family RNA polymerase sigma factor [Clostridium weizhouense]MBW6411525.1 sigma-70 family RNA polymerase sigma factor [Clostridium weizhouense]
MEKSLYNLITRVKQNDEDSLLTIINKFNLLIKKLSRKMVYEGAETDLIIYLIQMLRKLDLDKLKNFSEGGLVKYIQVSLNNKAIDHCKKYYLIKNNEMVLDINIIQQNFDTSVKNNIDNNLFIDELLNLKALTEHQKLILKYYYLCEYSDMQIANKLKISRQAVHKTRSYGLKIIKNYVTTKCS